MCRLPSGRRQTSSPNVVNWVELQRRLRQRLPPSLWRHTDVFLAKLPGRLREAQLVCRNLPSQLGRSVSKRAPISGPSFFSASSWASSHLSSFAPLMFLRSFRSRRFLSSFSHLRSDFRRKLFPVNRSYSLYREMVMWKDYTYRPFKVTYGIIAANVAVWGLWQVARPETFDFRNAQFTCDGLISQKFMDRHFTCNWQRLQSGGLDTLILANFSQSQFLHMAVNMVGVFFLGRFLEQLLGPRAFLQSYMACGIGGVALGCYVARHNRELTFHGASACVLGSLAMAALMRPRMQVLLYGIIPVPMAAVLGLSVAFCGFRYLRYNDMAETGHLAGLAVGAVIYYLKHRFV
eukprot:GHVS01028729.1.p1 GENE.GHVS01028729.1~~GHVS01028729.1.p1  ORF type:complete len:348 (+),score=33.27 GHVS01028729.1:98-1141(+)